MPFAQIGGALVRWAAVAGTVSAAGEVAPPDHAVEVAVIGAVSAMFVALGTPIVRELLARRTAKQQPDLQATVDNLQDRLDKRDELIDQLLNEKSTRGRR